AEDLQYIRGIATEVGSRVFGRAAVQSLSVKEKKFTFEPLQDIKVILEGNRRYEVITDSEGKFEFKNLPEGNYTLRSEFPAYLGEILTETMYLTGHGCVQIHQRTARRNTWIMGRVVDLNGSPVLGVPVSLVAADGISEEILLADKDKSFATFTLTDEKG